MEHRYGERKRDVSKCPLAPRPSLSFGPRAPACTKTFDATRLTAVHSLVKGTQGRFAQVRHMQHRPEYTLFGNAAGPGDSSSRISDPELSLSRATYRGALNKVGVGGRIGPCMLDLFAAHTVPCRVPIRNSTRICIACCCNPRKLREST